MMRINLKIFVIIILVSFLLGIGIHLLVTPQRSMGKLEQPAIDAAFGWKFPVAKFPLTGPNDNQIAYSNIRDPGGIPQGLPVRLKIPAIGVDTAIEDALISPDGRMDVPAGSVNVAWFALGPYPGARGSAVIGGHYGIDNGVPKVFYELNKLNIGDKIYIVDDTGDTLAFIVRSMSSFDRNADSTPVFTSQDGLAHLNLITCEGVWNQVNDSYPLRYVVFTDAIDSEGAIDVEKKDPPSALTALSPSATPASTREPVTTQWSTLASLSAIMTPASTHLLISSIKIVYATPVDGFVTSFLILSIFYLTSMFFHRRQFRHRRG